MAYPIVDHALLSLEDVQFDVSYQRRQIKKDDPTAVKVHIHSCYEVYVNVTGDVSFLVNSTVYPISSGSVLLTKPGDVHHCVYNADDTHEYFCLWIKTDHDSPLDIFLREQTLPKLYVAEEELRALLFERLHQLHQAQAQVANFYDTVCFMNCLDLICSVHPVKEEAPDDIPDTLKEVLCYIDTHFAEIGSICEILPRFYISNATLNRWFRRYVHLSPREFLEAKKLAYAEKLLKQKISITQVSEQAGFSDCSHFIAVFRKKFGQTPLRYRKQDL